MVPLSNYLSPRGRVHYHFGYLAFIARALAARPRAALVLGPKAMVFAKCFLATTAGSAGGGMDSKARWGICRVFDENITTFSPEALTLAIVLKVAPSLCALSTAEHR